jgi:hypothetical protein
VTSDAVLGGWTAPRTVPRTADRTLEGVGALCLKAFLCAQFLSLTRLFFSNHLGDGVATYASMAGLLSVGLLVPAVAAYGAASGTVFGRLVEGGRLWVCGLGLVAVSLFFYGWLVRGYALAPSAHDFAPYAVLLASAILGSLPKVWRDIDRTLLALFAVGLVINLLGMTEMSRVVSEATSEDRAGVSIVAYRTQGALAFWPLLFLTARYRRPAIAWLIYAGVFFVLGQQILFQKRSPTFRVALFVLVFLVILPRMVRVRAAAERRARVLFAAAGGLAVAGALAVAPWLFEGQMLGLAHRLSGEAYSGGAAGMLTTENERFFEARLFLSTLQPEEVVVGRGFGGYFRPDASWWGIWLEDVGEFGRRQLHVGGLMPFFKGGLLLTAAYYSGAALAVSRGIRARGEPLAVAALFVVLLHLLFLLQESWFVMSVSFDLTMVGLCLGHLLSRDLGARPRSVLAVQGGA